MSKRPAQKKHYIQYNDIWYKSSQSGVIACSFDLSKDNVEGGIDG